jgi:predicted Zn-dependent protease
MKPLSSILLGLSLTILLAGCYEVPVTGRKAMNIVDDKEVTKMSIAAFNDLKAHHPRSHDRERIDQLNRVGERISKVVFWDMPDADWEFVVFDEPKEINAFAMAGGKVGVFSGLYRIIENDDQLASVIAHEIAHVTAKHVHEKLSREMAVNTVGTVGMVGAGVGAGVLGALAVEEAYGATVATPGKEAAFDRKKEKEADYIGLMYMARAGYNPEESVKVLENLEAAQGAALAKLQQQSTFLSNHPSNPERIQQLLDSMPKAEELYRNSGKTATPTIVK